MQFTKCQSDALDACVRRGIDIKLLESVDAHGLWVAIGFDHERGLVPITSWGYSNLANVFKYIDGHFGHMHRAGDVVYVFRSKSQSTEWMRQVFDAAFGI